MAVRRILGVQMGEHALNQGSIQPWHQRLAQAAVFRPQGHFCRNHFEATFKQFVGAIWVLPWSGFERVMSEVTSLYQKMRIDGQAQNLAEAAQCLCKQASSDLGG
jgi:hypothetical protein